MNGWFFKKKVQLSTVQTTLAYFSDLVLLILIILVVILESYFVCPN